MSQENVEYVRRMVEAYGRGDFDTALASTPDDAEWVIAEENPNARTLRGPDEIRAYVRDWQETLGAMRYDIVELIDAGDAVVCLGKVSGRAGNDGPEVTVALATVTYFRDGVPVRTHEFLDAADALEAAGLKE
jgi:ketosteroid isomerase-like protein